MSYINFHLLPAHAIYCCDNCFKILSADNDFILVDKDNGECDCIEIEHGLRNPTPCAICQDKKVAGCPMHLHRIKIKRTKS